MERFHRHLKTSLRARLTGPQWAQELPWVLLGIRTAPKEDLGCSSAELVYGAPVTIPGEFFPAHTSQPNHNSELQRLREQVQALVPIPTSHHGITPISIPPDLQHSQYIFIRRDSHRTPLQRPYEGPFKVLQPGEKNFTIDIGGRKDTVSVDRLKPAHIEFQVPVAVAKHRGRPPRKVQPYLNTVPYTRQPFRHPFTLTPQGLDARLIYHVASSRFWGEWCSSYGLPSIRRTRFI